MPVSARFRQAARRSTSRFRALPGLLIVGGMRCGTSSLYEWMLQHDEFEPARKKEIHFFNHHFDEGRSWYLAFFPMAREGITTFDATPAYLSHPLAAERAAQTVPEAKIIASLRDPVERAWSHYRFRQARGYETRTFQDAIQDELTASPEGAASTARTAPYLAAGRYGEHIRTWSEAFDKDRILLVDANALFVGDEGTLADIDNFLEVPASQVSLPSVNSAPPNEIDEGIRRELETYYAESNRLLAELTDRPFRWLAR